MKPINYNRININDIHPEARRIAVAWVEGFEKVGGMEIQQKVKLASDIMNFAIAYHEELSTPPSQERSAEEILMSILPKDCYWEEMGNLTNTPKEYVLKAMEEYANQFRKP